VSDSKKQQTKPTGNAVTPETSTPSAPAEVVDAVPSTALTPAAINRASMVKAEALSYDDRIGAANDRLSELAAQNPEYSDRILDLQGYVASKIEGIVGDRGVPIPNLLVRQAMTKEENLPSSDIKVGGFYTKAGENLGTEVTVIALLGHFKRVKFNPGQDRPDCTSDDGVTGSRYGDCKTCPYAKYEEGARAACSSGYSYIAVTENFEKLFQIDFTKTSSKYGRKLQQMAVAPALFATAFVIYTDKETNAKGTFYVTKVKPTGKKVTGPEFEIARALAAFAMARFERNVSARKAARNTTSGAALGAGSVGDTESNDIDVSDM